MDKMIFWLMGVFLGIGLGINLASKIVSDQTRIKPQAVAEMYEACEAKLPRDVKCKLVVIPEVSDGNVTDR